MVGGEKGTLLCLLQVRYGRVARGRAERAVATMQLVTVVLLCGVLHFSNCFQFGYYTGQRYPVIVAGADTAIHSANGQYSLYNGSPMQWYPTIPMSWTPYSASHYSPVLNYQWKPIQPTYPLQYSSVHQSPLLIKLGYFPLNEQKTTTLPLKDLLSVLANLHSKIEPSQKITSPDLQDVAGTKELQKPHLPDNPENSNLPTHISTNDTSTKHFNNNSSLINNEASIIKEHSKLEENEGTNFNNETKSENSADKIAIVSNGTSSDFTNEKILDLDDTNTSSEPFGTSAETGSQKWNQILPNPLDNESITKLHTGQKNKGDGEETDTISVTNVSESATGSNIDSDELMVSNIASVTTENILETTTPVGNEYDFDNAEQSTTDLNLQSVFPENCSTSDSSISGYEIPSSTPIYNEENVLETTTILGVEENGTITPIDNESSSFAELLELNTPETEIVLENSTDISIIDYEIQTTSNLFEVATENLQGNVEVVSDTENTISSYDGDSSVDYSIDYEYQTESTTLNNEDSFTTDSYGGVNYSNNYGLQYSGFETTPIADQNENEFSYTDKYQTAPNMLFDHDYTLNRPIINQEHTSHNAHKIPTKNNSSSFTEQDGTNTYPEFNGYISETKHDVLNSSISENGEKSDDLIYDKSEFLEKPNLPENTESDIFETELYEEATEPPVYTDASESLSNLNLFSHTSLNNPDGFLVPEEDLEYATSSEYFPGLNENVQDYYEPPEKGISAVINDPSHLDESNNYYSNSFKINGLKNHYEGGTNSEYEHYSENKKDVDKSENGAYNPIHEVQSQEMNDKVKYVLNEELSNENAGMSSIPYAHDVSDGTLEFSVGTTEDLSSAYLPMATENYQPTDTSFSEDKQSIINYESHFPTGTKYLNTLQTNPQNEEKSEIVDDKIITSLLEDTKIKEQNPVYDSGTLTEEDKKENENSSDRNINKGDIFSDYEQTIPTGNFNYEGAEVDLQQELPVDDTDHELTEGLEEGIPVFDSEDTSFTDGLEDELTFDHKEDEFGSHDVEDESILHGLGGEWNADVDEELAASRPKDELIIENLKDNFGAGSLSQETGLENLEDDLTIGDLDEFAVGDLEDELAIEDMEDELAVEDMEDDLAVGDFDYGLGAREMQGKESVDMAHKATSLMGTPVSVNNRRSDIEIKEDNLHYTDLPTSERQKRSTDDSLMNSIHVHTLPSLHKNELKNDLKIDNNINMDSEASKRVKRTFDLLFGGGAPGLSALNPGNLLTNAIVKPILRRKYSFLRKKQLLLRLFVRMLELGNMGSSPF